VHIAITTARTDAQTEVAPFTPKNQGVGFEGGRGELHPERERHAHEHAKRKQDQYRRNDADGGDG
jgi:hypothetical protein